LRFDAAEFRALLARCARGCAVSTEATLHEEDTPLPLALVTGAIQGSGVVASRDAIAVANRRGGVF
jgi:hypothetical protein